MQQYNNTGGSGFQQGNNGYQTNHFGPQTNFSGNNTNIRSVIISCAVDGFKDKEVIPEEMLLEAITGAENTLLPISFLRRGDEIQRAVCKIVLKKTDEQPEIDMGTGFLISTCHVMTALHVMKSDVRNFEFIFDFDEDQVPVRCLASAADPVYIAELDCAIVQITLPKDFKVPHVALVEKPPMKLDRCNIIGHPKGATKRVSLQKNVIVKVNEELGTIRYTTDTRKGSSGAPVFNNSWKVIAMHLRKGDKDTSTEEKIWISNEGVLIKNLFEHPSFPSEIKKLHTSKQATSAVQPLRSRNWTAYIVVVSLLILFVAVVVPIKFAGL